MVKRACLLIFLFVIFSLKGNPNIKFPTLGGKLFWTDVKVIEGWRVQKNLVTGHFRLLNPRLIRYAWGNQQECLDILEDKTVIRKDKKTVFLIHGLGLRKRSLKCLKPQLEQAGYQVVMFGYSTFLESIEDSADKLDSVMSEYTGDIYVVTHSMGGILFRQYQKKYKRDFKALVMLAAPNQGTTFVDGLKDAGLDSLAGINGRRLHTGCDGLPKILPEPKGPFITIAGIKKNELGYGPQFFSSEESDGLVPESATRLSGAEAHYTFKVSHYKIMHKPEVQKLILNFFSSKSF